MKLAARIRLIRYIDKFTVTLSRSAPFILLSKLVNILLDITLTQREVSSRFTAV